MELMDPRDGADDKVPGHRFIVEAVDGMVRPESDGSLDFLGDDQRGEGCHRAGRRQLWGCVVA